MPVAFLRLLSILVFGALVASGCGEDDPCADRPADRMCSASTGAFGQPICTCATLDEGTACTDSDDCEGACVTTAPACEMATAGQCSAVDTVFGCYCRLEAGSGAQICVD